MRDTGYRYRIVLRGECRPLMAGPFAAVTDRVRPRLHLHHPRQSGTTPSSTA
jgi:hypothetical protein